MPIFVGYSGEWTPIKDLYGKGASGEWEAAEAIYVGVNGEWVLVEDEYVPPAPEYPIEIGEFFGGGYYIGNISITGAEAGTYALIMAPPEANSGWVQWKTTNTNTPNSDSNSDGWVNTLAIIDAGIDNHPAAKHCVNYAGGGFTDWYLPARGELNLAWVNKPLLSSLVLSSSDYWNSRQGSATHAWFNNLGSGDMENSKLKTQTCMVRPVRRIKLPNP